MATDFDPQDLQTQCWHQELAIIEKAMEFLLKGLRLSKSLSSDQLQCRHLSMREGRQWQSLVPLFDEMQVSEL
eukprot:7442600-Karenia_brevis.AAC.1